MSVKLNDAVIEIRYLYRADSPSPGPCASEAKWRRHKDCITINFVLGLYW